MILPALFVGALFYVSFTRTPDGPQQMVLQGEALGTTWTLKVAGESQPDREDELRAVVEKALSEVDVSMSTYREDSELMAFNRSDGLEPFAVSDLLGKVLGEAVDIGFTSGGAFDVTVGPLVNAWGFGPDKERTQPDRQTLESLQSRIGHDKLELTPNGITKDHPELSVDLSAIAKGFAVDLVVDRLVAAGAENVLMEVGGEIVARGENPNDHPWRLGIETPTETGREVHHVVALRDAAMATSGDYRQYYEVEGRRISHLIDPRTSQPIEHRLASVTVIADRCSTADAWATALSVMGEIDGFELAEKLQLKAYFIVRNDTGGFSTQSTRRFNELR